MDPEFFKVPQLCQPLLNLFPDRNFVEVAADLILGFNLSFVSPSPGLRAIGKGLVSDAVIFIYLVNLAAGWVEEGFVGIGMMRQRCTWGFCSK